MGHLKLDQGDPSVKWKLDEYMWKINKLGQKLNIKKMKSRPEAPLTLVEITKGSK